MTRRDFGWSVVSLGALAMLAAPGRADVRYTTQMTFGETAGTRSGAATDAAAGEAPEPGMRTTTFVKDNNERVETVMQMGPMQMKTVTLTLCGQKQTIQMDPDLKIYTVKPIGMASMMPAAAAVGTQGARPKAASRGPAGTGKVVMTYTVQDLGPEKVVNLNTRHMMITMRSQSSGCAGDADTTMKMEIWTAPIKTLSCPERFNAGASGGSGPADGGDCKITYEMKGDVEKIKSVYSGMIVQQKFYQGDKVTMTQTLREHSLAALDPALFSVPSGYKQLTEAEFAKAQQEAMQKNMMRGMGRQDDNAAAEKANATPGVDSEDAEDAPPADAEKTEEKPKKKKIKIPGLKLPF